MKTITPIILFVAIVINGFGQPKPPVPENLSGEVIKIGAQDYIRLEWDDKSPQDTLTYGYFIYHNFPPKDKLYFNGKINLITESNYDFEIKSDQGAIYKFAVQAVSEFPEKIKSDRSEVLEVKVMSKELPLVKVTEVLRSEDKVKITWSYSEVWDLEGFRIFANGKMVADETVLDKESRSHEFDCEGKAIIEIKAISQSKVSSKGVKRIV